MCGYALREGEGGRAKERETDRQCEYKTYGSMEKRGQNKQIEVTNVRNFQAQITRNKILTHSSHLCVSRQFAVFFTYRKEEITALISA